MVYRHALSDRPVNFGEGIPREEDSPSNEIVIGSSTGTGQPLLVGPVALLMQMRMNIATADPPIDGLVHIRLVH